MKKLKITVLLLALSALGSYAFIPVVREEVRWFFVTFGEGGHENYLKKYPAGRHVQAANEALDQLDWQACAKQDSTWSYEKYLEKQPAGLFAQAARDTLESREWQTVKRKNTVVAFERFAASYPRGKQAAQALTSAANLRKDDAPFEQAKQKNAEEAWRQFLSFYPGHQKETEAKRLLREFEQKRMAEEAKALANERDAQGRNIFDLLKEGKISVEVTGSGIEQVSLRVKSLVSHRVQVEVPVGTFFVCRGAAQNMVGTSSESITLTGQESEWLTVPAACANRTRDIPDGDNTFSVQRSPKQKDLQKLMPELEREGVAYSVRQAAVWIVTDNADYDDLGILTSSFNGFGGSRAIDESDAVRAMQICAQAGIAIQQKAIWGDRQYLLKEVRNTSQGEWLAGKMRK